MPPSSRAPGTTGPQPLTSTPCRSGPLARWLARRSPGGRPTSQQSLKLRSEPVLQVETTYLHHPLSEILFTTRERGCQYSLLALARRRDRHLDLLGIAEGEVGVAEGGSHEALQLGLHLGFAPGKRGLLDGETFIAKLRHGAEISDAYRVRESVLKALGEFLHLLEHLEIGGGKPKIR